MPEINPPQSQAVVFLSKLLDFVCLNVEHAMQLSYNQWQNYRREEPSMIGFTLELDEARNSYLDFPVRALCQQFSVRLMRRSFALCDDCFSHNENFLVE